MRKLLEFHRSPNSVRVRIGLEYKRLEYETEEMMAADRAPMLEAAAWPLVPVLIDGDVVMRDSVAILHYLESNYRDAPSLTPATRDEIRSAEALLLNLRPEILRIQWRAAPEIGKPEEDRNLERIEIARRALNDALLQLEGRLGGQPWLVGDSMSMYDVILACDLLPSRAPRAFVEESPIWRFYDEHFGLEEDRAHVAAWMDRVLAWDAGGAGGQSASMRA